MANGVAGRPRDEVPSIRLRFGDGYIHLGQDPEMDRLYTWIQSLPRGMKFKSVAARLLTGTMMEAALPADQVEEMRKAAEEIMANFVVDC